MADERHGGQPPQDEPEANGAGEGADDVQLDASAPRITLDWKPRGKRGTYAAVGQLLTLVFMLAALVAIFMFKDRCGESVSNVIFMATPDAGAASQPAAPPARP